MKIQYREKKKQVILWEKRYYKKKGCYVYAILKSFDHYYFSTIKFRYWWSISIYRIRFFSGWIINWLSVFENSIFLLYKVNFLDEHL
jgi:hypothetical protein